MKLEERTIQSKLRYWAKQTRTAAVIAGPPADVLDEAADRLEQAQTLAEERLISIGHWKAALEETVRERDESRGQLLAFKEVRAAAQAEAAAELDCGQGTVCARPPGCRRHWEERNRELVAQLENALDASKEGSWMARALDAQRELERAQRETRMARSSANRMHDLLYEAEERCSKARGERDELKARLADRERELSLLQQAAMGATASELTVNACQTDLKTDEDRAALGEIVRAGRERLIPPAERGFGLVGKVYCKTDPGCVLADGHGGAHCGTVSAAPESPEPYGHLSRANPDDEAAMTEVPEAVEACRVPPAGWYCTRGAGHDGPCAAVKLVIPAAPKPPPPGPPAPPEPKNWKPVA
jgi:hypothetical protein